MKKISLLLIAVTTIASAQLRLGLDVSREMTVSGMSGEKSGYEQMLLSLVGVGAEYTAGGDEGVDMLYGYAVGKIPVGFPMVRGIIRAGYSLPMGDAADFYEAGLAYGVGLRVKPPIFPIGIEALYTMHNLEMKSSGDDMEDMFMALFKIKWNVLNITATYSF